MAIGFNILTGRDRKEILKFSFEAPQMATRYCELVIMTATLFPQISIGYVQFCLQIAIYGVLKKNHYIRIVGKRLLTRKKPWGPVSCNGKKKVKISSGGG